MLLLIFVGVFVFDAVSDGGLVALPASNGLSLSEVFTATFLFGCGGAVTSIIHSGARTLNARTTDSSVPHESFVYEAVTYARARRRRVRTRRTAVDRNLMVSTILANDFGSNVANVLVLRFLAGLFDQLFKNRLESFVQTEVENTAKALDADSGDSSGPSG